MGLNHDRRAFLASAAAGATLCGWLGRVAASAAGGKRPKSCILLWMAGGPSQFETFDPKPEHKNGGETTVIETAVPGIQIAKGWEKTAAAMKDIAIVQTIVGGESCFKLER